MIQYCRYCAYMCCGDANYCSVKKRCYSDEHIKRTNKCKDFDLCPIDALGENTSGYKPRERKEPSPNNQMSLFSSGTEGMSVWPPVSADEDADELKEQAKKIFEYVKENNNGA